MGKTSGIQRYAEQFAQAKVEAAQRLISQYMIDTMQMTLHQTEGWGYDRIMRVTHAWMETQREYRPALNCKDPEADVRQEHMDRVAVVDACVALHADPISFLKIVYFFSAKITKTLRHVLSSLP